jgi:xylan 1,4-beta-xylosidase
MRAQSTRVRQVVVDAAVAKGPLNRMFNACVGAGRANEGLRADWQRQLRMVKAQLGFRYIRMHGLLCDDMGVYRVDASGQPEYNWQYIDELYDFLEEVHVRPFVELGFMPQALASGPQTIFWWRGNVTPPNNYDRWGNLIRALVRHWVERYGEQEVRQWYFEVWNEPNLKGGFWTGDQAEYFKLYAVTARAVKSVSPAFRVGGPATAGNGWIPEFIDYCARNNVPVDFVSTHTYGVDQGFLDEHGNRGTVLSKNDSSIYGDIIHSRQVIDRSPLPGLELHYTEWSSSYTPSDPLHDSYEEAAYVLEKIRKTGNAANSMSYWTFTDIFEEAGPRFTPFHGGFGLVNYEDIAKPAFFAYKYLNQLGGTELADNDASSWACKDEHGDVQLLAWDYTNKSPADSVNDQVYYKRDLPARPKGQLETVVAHLQPGVYRVSVYLTGYRANDAYDAYLDLGSPAQLTKQQVARIREQSSDAPVRELTVTVPQDGRFTQVLPLRENDIYLIKLHRLAQPATSLRVVSPNGAIGVTVDLDGQGYLHYRVDYTAGGKTVEAVPRSNLGIMRTDGDFSAGLTYVGLESARKVVDRYRLLHGKRQYCRNEAMEKVFRFRNSHGQLLDLQFRAYDNGAAFRYDFPGHPADSCRVTGEATGFTIPDGSERWMQQYTIAYEGLYPLNTDGKGDSPDHHDWGFPALYRVKDQPVWVLVTEAGVSGANCASHLSNAGNGEVYTVSMPQSQVSAAFPWHSAWRVLMIGRLADIVESTLVTDVSEPSRLTDTGWIKPGPVSWVYWAYNHGSKDYRKVMEYVDLAVKMHWPYVLIDWEWDRMGNGGRIEDAVAYARSKGIKPLMWYNSKDSTKSSPGFDPYGRMTTHAARCREFAWLNKIGVYGVKVDFFEDDRQGAMAYYLDLLADAAKYHIMVDFHGATLPKGWDRTYPNLMTMEAVYGAEWYGYAPVLEHQGATHNATLPFTRNVVGSMDYTPVTFSDLGFPHTTTYAHELALSVVFESGLQHFADKPEAFYALPDTERRFLMTVPVAWDDTRLVDGYPGKRVEIARRKGDAWYVGGLNGDDQAQELELTFDFLDDKAYDLSLITDGTTAREFGTKTLTVRKGSRVRIPCLPRGGFVAMINIHS